MPIGFRCQTCRTKLSTAKRKAGSTVTCPNCASEVRVPSADTLDPKLERVLAAAGASPVAEANVELVTEVAAPKPKPAKLPPPKLNDLPLFEREDFDKLLDEKTDAKLEGAPAPLPLPAPSPATDGILLTRGMLTMVGVAVAALLALAFGAGWLVGKG